MITTERRVTKTDLLIKLNTQSICTGLKARAWTLSLTVLFPSVPALAFISLQSTQMGGFLYIVLPELGGQCGLESTFLLVFSKCFVSLHHHKVSHLAKVVLGKLTLNVQITIQNEVFVGRWSPDNLTQLLSQFFSMCDLLNK